MPQPKLSIFCEYLEENQVWGFIYRSTLPTESPILFVKNKQRKKDGSLCLSVDYWVLNQITICNQYLLPLIPAVLDWLKIDLIFTKLVLQGAYNLVRVFTGDELKTSFRM